jgi:hypothetical protein
MANARQTRANAREKHGQDAANAWQSHGTAKPRQRPFKIIGNGTDTAKTRHRHGKDTEETRQRHGKYRTPTWEGHGNATAKTRQHQCGKDMSKARQRHGNNATHIFAKTWHKHDKDAANAWPLHGTDMTTTLQRHAKDLDNTGKDMAIT